MYGVRHFHQYLYGQCFTLVTDHQPLTTILSPKRGIPSLAAARLQRWAIILSAYWYDIEFQYTQDHGNADGLSRLPLPSVRKSHTPSEVWPERPWQRVHIDFAGPLKGKMYFVLVDAHSKWPEVVEMQTTTAEKTIQVLRRMFAAYGLLEQVVSDNGSQFTSQEFAEFMKRNGIKHRKSTPYHPSTNGLAE